MSERLPLALVLTPTALRQSGINWLFPSFTDHQGRQAAVYTAHEANRVIAVVEDLRVGNDGRIRRDWYFGVLPDEPDKSYLDRIPSMISRQNRVNNQELSLHLLAAVGMASLPKKKNGQPQPKVEIRDILKELRESA
jgi:hypothetical protein